jgi:hypothetical protein
MPDYNSADNIPGRMIRKMKRTQSFSPANRSYGFLVIICVVGFMATACQVSLETAPSPTPSPTITGSNPVVATTTSATTLTPTALPPSVTSPAITPSPMPSVSPTARPTRDPFPTPQPTHSFWQIENEEPFLLFSDNHIVRLLQLDEPTKFPRFVSDGDVPIEGYPWSPDGVHFIFTAVFSDQEQFAIANLQTGDVLPLQFNPHQLYWSPDGKSILYVTRSQSGPIQIKIYEVWEQRNQVVAEIPVQANSRFILTGWAPDSDTIAFIAQMNEQYDLYTLRVSNPVLTQLTNTPEAEVWAIWSPTNEQLFFGTYPDPSMLDSTPYIADTLYLINGFYDNPPTLVESGAVTTEPAWSPDGTQIAYSNDGELCILALETLVKTCPLQATLPIEQYSVAFQSPPAWSADSQWLAFGVQVRDEVTCPTLHLFNMTANTLIPIDSDNCIDGAYYWSR